MTHEPSKYQFNVTHVQHYLLPVKRDSLITDRLPSAKSFPIGLLRFKNSFLLFALINFE